MPSSTRLPGAVGELLHELPDALLQRPGRGNAPDTDPLDRVRDQLRVHQDQQLRIEDAGIATHPLVDANVGVFMGIMGQDYAFLPTLDDEDVIQCVTMIEK